MMRSPLDGLKVLELARVLAGPWAGQLLADLGAEVIKVESPIGDETRKWGEDSFNNNSSYFKCTNRGKSSFVANFKKKNELEMVQHLAKNADIIIENYKVDDLKKYTSDLIKMQMQQYGQSVADKKNIEQTVARVMSNKEEVKRLTEQLCGDRILNFFKANISYKSKKLTYDQFIKEAYQV